MGWDATTWASIWATIGLVIFIGIVIYLKVPAMIARLLDERIAKIEADLGEAKRLREEAQVLLAQYEQKRIAAEADAAAMLANAKEEAVRLTEEANASLADLIARRTKAVEEKIAQAEVQALAEVRARSADAAIELARTQLTQRIGSEGPTLVDRAIADVSAKLN